MLTAPLQAQYVQAPRATETYGPTRGWDDDVPARLSFVQGTVTLERAGRLEPAEANLALLAGDRLRTKGGRVEILFADGSALYVDENTDLDLLSDALLRLPGGRVHLSIARSTGELDYRIDAPSASVWIQTAGEYTVDVYQARREGSEVDLRVIRGSAELVNEHGNTLVGAGTHAVATSGLAPSVPYVINTAEQDEFDHWIDQQRSAHMGTYSTRYLPTELRYDSGAFDNYGSWDYLPAYGYVWYPRVAYGWRPYSQGRWSFGGHYGWFWVGIDPWSWATHHYGRWGLNAGSWYWIPDRHWSPAWVSWGSAPGYVSWCPLGFDGRPVYGFHHTDPWYAWTVMPSRHLIPNVWVTQHIVVPTAIVPVVRTQFVERMVAPVVPAIATPRIAPIHAPTFSAPAAVARNAGPAYDGEESWRSRVTNSAVPRGTPSGSAAARDGARYTAQPAADVQRTVPQRSRVAGVGRPEIPGTQLPTVDVPRASVPDRTATSGDDARAVPRRTPSAQSDDDPRVTLGTANSRSARPSEPSRPSTSGSARPRPEVYYSQPARPSVPAQRSEPERAPSGPPDRAVPRESAPRFGSDAPRQSAPPSRSEPARSEPSRGEPARPPSRVPDRAAPPQSAPPPSAAPAPSGGRGGSSTPPPPPAARGGGSESRAVPRARGGGV